MSRETASDVQKLSQLIPNAPVINIKQYCIPQKLREVMQEIVDDFERQGLVEKCLSNFNSPAILVAKKDDFGTKTDYRLCIDLNTLNTNDSAVSR